MRPARSEIKYIMRVAHRRPGAAIANDLWQASVARRQLATAKTPEWAESIRSSWRQSMRHVKLRIEFVGDYLI